MEGLRGYLVYLACYFAFAFALLPVVVIAAGSGVYEAADDFEFFPRPKDRPVLETVQQVWEARTTGVSTFRIGSEYYIVENLPKEYVDYSSWYVRMP